ncbi:MAG: type II secretion system protein GspM [Nitrospirae bacterium]|nr:type II secretion system protein GspM [Nitrospirota bacterium]MCL5284162.1 type II secretion system protein GspM [Nitrospirota bacterium]
MTRSGLLRALSRKADPWIHRLRLAWERLTERERRLVHLLATLLAGLALWTAVTALFWDPYLAKREEIEGLKSEMLKVLGLSQEIQSTRALINAQTRKLGQEERGFSLIAYLEEEADHAHIRSQVSRMTPRNLPSEGAYRIGMVSMKIDSVDLPHAVFFLARLERSPHFIRITRLSMKRRFNDHSKLDLQIDVEAVQPT